MRKTVRTTTTTTSKAPAAKRPRKAAESAKEEPPAKPAPSVPAVREVLGTLTALHRRDSLGRASTRRKTAEELLRQRVESALRERLSALQAEVELLRAALATSDALRRKALEQAQRLSGKIAVFVRLRPALRTGELPAVCIPEPDAVSMVGSGSLWRFTGAFAPTSTNDEVFDRVSAQCESVLDGRSCCILAYGQTSSGKTHTVFGSPQDPGIVPRALELVFAGVERLRAAGWSFSVHASFVEAYNEQLRDLLAQESASKSRPSVRHDAQNRPVLCGVDARAVASSEEASECMRAALANRAVATTESNARSSRSHVLFRLQVDGHHEAQGTTTSAMLDVVDLAGSEKFANGLRAAETVKINQSLSTLTTCIRELAQRSAHVRFRDSVLTHLLQSSLDGSSKVVLIATLSPSPGDREETLSSLRFAGEAANCVLKPSKLH